MTGASQGGFLKDGPARVWLRERDAPGLFVWFSLVWSGLVWFSLVCFSLVCSGLLGSARVRLGLLRSAVVRSGLRQGLEPGVRLMWPITWCCTCRRIRAAPPGRTVTKTSRARAGGRRRRRRRSVYLLCTRHVSPCQCRNETVAIGASRVTALRGVVAYLESCTLKSI